MLAILGCIVAGCCLTLAVAMLALAGEDRRFLRREERDRQRKIDRALGRAER